MNGFPLKMLTPYHFIDFANMHQTEDSYFTLGNYKKPVFKSVMPKLDGRTVDVNASYKINQIFESKSFIGRFLGLEKAKPIGELKIVSGLTDSRSQYSGSYEVMTLQINSPLKLDDCILPACQIRIQYECEDVLPPLVSREDYERLLPGFRPRLFWKRTNLEELLPTPMFTRYVA